MVFDLISQLCCVKCAELSKLHKERNGLGAVYEEKKQAYEQGQEELRRVHQSSSSPRQPALPAPQMQK